MSGTPTSQQAFTPHRLHLTGWLRHRGSGGLRWWQRWLGVVLGVLLAVSMGLDPRLAAADPVSKLPDAQVWEPVASSEAALGGEGGAVSPEQVRPVTPVFPAGSGAVGADAQGRQAWRPVGDTSVEVLTDAAVTVAIADPVVADTAGINGVVFAVALPEGVSVTDVRLDYAGFDAAAGGGYGSRLQLVTLPECVLTRPGDPACRKPSPVVSSVNDPKADTVQAQVVAPDGTAATGDVELDGVVSPADGQSARPSSTDTQSSLSAPSLPSAASAEASAGSARPSAAEAGSPSDGGSVQPSVAATGQPSASVSSAGRSAVAVMAAVAGGSGSNGSFEATPLAATGSWSVGGSTGGFEWSYPVSVPVAATGGGLSPNITIGYSSSRVDGKVASSNNQPGWIGQGFDYDPGFIERSYQSCRDTGDEEMEDSGELCWAGEVLTFGRAGFTERLVHDDDTGMYRPQTDDGTRVERLTGADNGALDGEHWKVTTPAGLVYYYGLGTNLWDEGTNSVYTVPVVGLNEGDRCYDSDGVDESRCDQAWRWNVDYAEDTHGNAMVFVYAPETNYYSPDPDSDPLEYVRGRTLERIDYGIRVNGDDVSGPTNSIDFLVDERCIPDDDFGCNPNKFTAKNAKYWPDTPQDLDCDADDCDNYSPSFWSRKRLREINTWVGDTQIDNFLFEQSYPKLGDNSLWLDSITRTGFAPDGD